MELAALLVVFHQRAGPTLGRVDLLVAHVRVAGQVNQLGLTRRADRPARYRRSHPPIIPPIAGDAQFAQISDGRTDDA
jgi:hypothetical protein